VWIHPDAALAFIAIGAAFDVFIGMRMGLNIFFWSFASTYPAVCYVSQQFSWLGPR